MSSFIVSSGVTSTLNLSAGDVETVFAGGTALNGTVFSGGSLLDGGLVSQTIVLSGGYLNIGSGGSAVGLTVSGGPLVVSGGVSENVAFIAVSAGGTVRSTELAGNASMDLHGSAVGTTVISGAYASVASGGIASGTILSGVGLASSLSAATFSTFPTQEVRSGGQAFGTVVSASGYEIVDGGGVDNGSILSGAALAPGAAGSPIATEIVAAGGVANGTQIGGLGVLDVLGTAANATVTSGGFLTISAGGTATGAVVSSGGSVTVLSGGLATGTVFELGSTIDLPFLVYSGGLSGTVDQNDVLHIIEGGATYILQLAGSYVGEAFNAVGDSLGGTFVTIACYCPGTMILTEDGEVPIETLEIGDRVMTGEGAAAICWIGRRSYAGRFLAGRAHLLPIRIAAGALGEGLPRRDLRVSPSHAIFLDGVLVPAIQLVNGATIMQERDCPAVEYIHLELPAHAVIWAEGALAETFVDDGSRGMFQNASDYVARYPGADAPPPAAVFCASRIDDGYELEAIRSRLAAVAAAICPPEMGADHSVRARVVPAFRS